MYFKSSNLAYVRVKNPFSETRILYIQSYFSSLKGKKLDPNEHLVYKSSNI